MNDLIERARAAQLNAHAPYSGFRIGAALRVAGGAIFSGCNVENASYGATICAERGAVMSAIAALGRLEIVEIVVVTSDETPWPPCGMCRQVLAEFCTPQCAVHAVDASANVRSWRFDALFPSGFTSDFLARTKPDS